MGIYRNERVCMPTSGTYLKKNNNTTYVYLYTEYYRNSIGLSRNKSCVIGILDEENNLLIPNDNYYKINNSSPALSYNSVLSYGFTFLIDHIAQSIGLKAILNDVFGKQSIDILAMATYMIHQGTVMNYCDDWLNDHYISDLSHQINSQVSSDIFTSISFDKRNDFFDLWVQTVVDNEYICYDVTSISSYSLEIIEVERGYNRDNENLAQVNLGMFCGEKTRLPVYYNLYNGSLTDKSNLISVIKNANEVGLKNIKLVMDGGFCDKKRLNELVENNYIFTVGVPTHLKESQKIIKEYGQGINKASNKLKYHQEYCKRIEKEFMGIQGNILLCFNETLHSDLTSSLLAKVEKLEEKLKKMKKLPSKGIKLYQKYFEITKTENNLIYKRKEDVIDEEVDMAGYFLLFTIDMDSDVEELLYYYRAKDVDEKLFYQLKVYMNGNRLRVHNEKAMEGKVFVIFIALIIRSYLSKKLKDYLSTEHITLKKAIYRLSDIKIIKNRETYYYLKELTKKQKDILNIFSLLEKMNTSLSEL